jgi:hypothetical protein
VYARRCFRPHRAACGALALCLAPVAVFGLCSCTPWFAVAATHAVTDLPVPATLPTPTPIAAATPLKIGIAFGNRLPGMSATNLGKALDDVTAVGGRWVRLDLDWNDVEPVDGAALRWTDFDRVVLAAKQRSLSLLPILTYTPAWARPAGCGSPMCAPADPARFAAFVRAAVRRYSLLGIHTWEIWNEPNLTIFWRPAPDPARYVTLLRQAASAIRAADPAATIVSGGLAPTDAAGGVPQLDFVAAFCRLGGNRLVDAIGYHPYSYPVTASDPAEWNAWSKIERTTPSFRSILAANGTPAMKVWATEFGAPTAGPGVEATNADKALSRSPDHVDAAYQATIAADAVRTAAASGTVAALFWYTDRDLGTSTATVENFFGLRDVTGGPKPAFTALRDAVAALRRQQPSG